MHLCAHTSLNFLCTCVLPIFVVEHPARGVGLDVQPQAVQHRLAADDLLVEAALPDGRAGRAMLGVNDLRHGGFVRTDNCAQ